jgi:hypothetical protein
MRFDHRSHKSVGLSRQQFGKRPEVAYAPQSSRGSTPRAGILADQHFEQELSPLLSAGFAE